MADLAALALGVHPWVRGVAGASPVRVFADSAIHVVAVSTVDVGSTASGQWITRIDKILFGGIMGQIF